MSNWITDTKENAEETDLYSRGERCGSETDVYALDAVVEIFSPLHSIQSAEWDP